MRWNLFFLCFVEISSVDKYVNVYKYVTSIVQVVKRKEMFTATSVRQ